MGQAVFGQLCYIHPISHGQDLPSASATLGPAPRRMGPGWWQHLSRSLAACGEQLWQRRGRRGFSLRPWFFTASWKDVLWTEGNRQWVKRSCTIRPPLLRSYLPKRWGPFLPVL